MSTATRTRATHLTGGHVPFFRHVRIELRKMTDTRAGLALIIAIAVITIGAVLLPLWIFQNPAGLTWSAFVDFASGGWSLLLPFIGVLAATSEWSQRTALTTFVLEPRRTFVNLAKLVAAVLLGLVMVAATYAAAAIVNVIGMLLFDGVGTWTLTVGSVVGYVLTMVIYVALGVGLGLLLMNTPLAIVAFVAAPLIVSIVGLFPAFTDVVPWIDLAGATMPLMAGELTGTEWAHLASTVALWCVVPIALGLWRAARREVL